MTKSSINCTSCGAGLDVFGGGRVRAHVCGYCGAELDAQDDYKVLRKFRETRRPSTPFELGMEGEIDGVKVIVIGTIERREAPDSWVEHQLYSPTHGYAWLSWENGHILFSRKTRKPPSPERITHSQIEAAENPPSIVYQGDPFRYYQSGTSQITFVEGEFNFVPKLDDRSDYVTFRGDDRLLTMALGEEETEYELTTMPDRAALLSSFGIPDDKAPAPAGVHALTPFKRSENVLLIRKVAFACAALCLLAALFLGGVGTKIATGSASNDAVLKLPFSVTNGSQLVQVDIQADVSNAWAAFDAEIVDTAGEPVEAFETGVSYYSGGDWSEGSTSTEIAISMAEGDYTLNLAMTETQNDYGYGSAATRMSATVWQGVVSTFWLWLGFIVFLVIGVVLYAQRILHNMRRAAGGDWTSD